MLHKPRVKDNIWEAWNEPSIRADGSISNRLRQCSKALSHWKKTNPMNSRDKITQIQIILEKEQFASFPRFYLVTKPKKELMLTYREEETYWK